MQPILLLSTSYVVDQLNGQHATAGYSGGLPLGRMHVALSFFLEPSQVLILFVVRAKI